MLVKDALDILKPENTSEAAIKTAWRRACSQYHPDKGGSVQMMQAVNEALETLLRADNLEQPDEYTDYGDQLNAALNVVVGMPGLDIEICGAWIWVGGDTRTHKDMLKAAGFRWAPKKSMWHYRSAGFRSYGRGRTSMDDIRNKYGSTRPNFTPTTRVTQL
jgi:curved DNA-binding protein CbpA